MTKERPRLKLGKRASFVKSGPEWRPPTCRRSRPPGSEPLDAVIAGMVVVLPVTAEIAVRAASLDWNHRDPCDRHIVATAAEHKLPLLTIDEKIHDLAGVRGLKVVW